MKNRTITLSSLLALLLAAGCQHLSERDRIRLDTFKQNSKSYYGASQFRRAEDSCRKGLKLAPRDLSLSQVLGFSLLRQGGPTRVQEAVRVFEYCIELENKPDIRNRLGLGEARFQLGLLWGNQITVIEADEKLTMEERELKLAQANQSMDQSFQAAEDFLLEVLSSPRGRDDVNTQSTLARLYSVRGRYDEAAEVLRSMIATLSNSIHVRSENMSLDTLPADRREYYEEMLTTLEAQRVQGLRLLATIAAKMDRWEEVTSAYARLEALKAMEPADYYNRARAYEALESREAAIENYETFIREAASRGASFIDAVSDAMRRSAALEDGQDFRKQY